MKFHFIIILAGAHLFEWDQEGDPPSCWDVNPGTAGSMNRKIGLDSQGNAIYLNVTVNATEEEAESWKARTRKQPVPSEMIRPGVRPLVATDPPGEKKDPPDKPAADPPD